MKPTNQIFAAAAASLLACSVSAPAEVLISNINAESEDWIYDLEEGGSLGKSFLTGPLPVRIDSVTLAYPPAGPSTPNNEDYLVRILTNSAHGTFKEAFVYSEPGIVNADQYVNADRSIKLKPNTEYLFAVTKISASAEPLLLAKDPTQVFSELGAAMRDDFYGFSYGPGELWIPAPGPAFKMHIEATPVPPDNRAPNICQARASVSMLWPPNGKMVPFSILGVTDPDGDEVTIQITKIEQNEPVTTPDLDKTSPDSWIVGPNVACVRAERTGNSAGRIYTISFTATDGKANGTSEGRADILVPHDDPTQK